MHKQQHPEPGSVVSGGLKLKGKLLISLFLVVSISSAATTLFAIDYFSNKINTEAVENMRRYIRVAEQVYGQKLLELSHAANKLAENGTLRVLLNFSTEEKISQYLETFLDPGIVHNIVTMSAQGELRGMVHNGAFSGQNKDGTQGGEDNFSDLLLFMGADTHFLLQKALTEKRTIVKAELLTNEEQTLVAISAAAPVYNSKSIKSDSTQKLVGAVLVRYILNGSTQLATEIHRLLDVSATIYQDAKAISFASQADTQAPPIERQVYDTVVRTNRPLEETKIRTGGYLAEYIPLIDAHDVPVAVLAVNEPATKYVETMRSAIITFIVIMLACIVLAFILGYLLARSILLPIRHLMKGVEQASAGNLEHTIEVKTKDELGILANAFNSMTSQLKDLFGTLERKNAAFERFVPIEFLRHLHREAVEDIDLGDASQEHMSVLFSDVRSFTSLSESMTPAETFAFLNEYLKYIGPNIVRHGGFIDKYIGDAIMALFAGTHINSAHDAIASAVGMIDKLHEFNWERQKKLLVPVNIGIGIHSGDLTLGTIGFDRRMESTVIGDTVNLASRVEGLTKMYGITIGITEVTYQGLAESHSFFIREVDTVQVKGKEKAITIYEVFNGDSSPVKEAKCATLKKYNEALHLYRLRQWKDALRLFKEIQGQLPSDKITALYTERCSQLIERPPEDEQQWTGITRLTQK